MKLLSRKLTLLSYAKVQFILPNRNRIKGIVGYVQIKLFEWLLISVG